MANTKPGCAILLEPDEFDFVRKYGHVLRSFAELRQMDEEWAQSKKQEEDAAPDVQAMRDYVYRQEAHGLVVESLPVDDLKFDTSYWPDALDPAAKPKLNRVYDWELFSAQVRRHIEEYTIAQYDNPDGNGQIEEMDAGECITHIKGYVTRFGKGVRGPAEELRDLLKIAHWASFAYSKRAKELDIKWLYGDVE